jgi:hypothetical protein
MHGQGIHPLSGEKMDKEFKASAKQLGHLTHKSHPPSKGLKTRLRGHEQNHNVFEVTRARTRTRVSPSGRTRSRTSREDYPTPRRARQIEFLKMTPSPSGILHRWGQIKPLRPSMGKSDNQG